MDFSVSSDVSLDSKILSSINTDNTKKAKEKKTVGKQGGDSISMDMGEVYKSLTILGDKVVSKLNELLKTQVPGGIQSLKPEEHTAEATADRIVSGVVGLLPAFAKQNPELEGEELMNKFMETVKGGIQKGYEDAVGILEGLGAFEFDGVKSGIEETMKLVSEKLDAFMAQLLGKKDDSVEAEPAVEPTAEVVPVA